MKKVAVLLNEMVEAGIITNYAVFGAVAQMRYTEAVATLDADILVAIPDPDAIDALSPIYRFCREHGYKPEGESIRVGNWPVQFIPAFSPLTAAAISRLHGRSSRSVLMKNNIKAMLERQTDWQRSRSKLSWAEKLRTSLMVRGVSTLMRTRPSLPPSGTPR
jgi:hypothetical protein